jgi:hypothetical protein
MTGASGLKSRSAIQVRHLGIDGGKPGLCDLHVLAVVPTLTPIAPTIWSPRVIG